MKLLSTSRNSPVKSAKPKPRLILTAPTSNPNDLSKLSVTSSLASQGANSPGLIPIPSPVLEHADHNIPQHCAQQTPGSCPSPLNLNQSMLLAPHLSQSKEAFSPLPPTPGSTEKGNNTVGVFEAIQRKFLESPFSTKRCQSRVSTSGY
ncbi:hypothetical protein O181_017546 [Austropuccinia psidii MF-1]|uniref:Uncharacterized protein n=1 Tax=Austropuccinia psidii MF-1 TaxID=1389203 RepID=A0A9Q3C7T2_9BASI|nr:hypothetical protein [Austropuccinia psidii MF-1]